MMNSLSSLFRLPGLFSLFFVVLSSLSGAQNQLIWIEAETYTTCNFPHFEKSSMGKEALLSGGQWIMKGVGEKEVASLVPDEGVKLTYQFQAKNAGQYTLWARVGWFRARAACKIRLNGKDWIDLPSDYPTRNLMELGCHSLPGN